jgi:hypothetical protein
LRLIELLGLLLKHGENAARRIAGSEPVCEWVRKEIILCALFICFQCIIENWLEVGRCGRGVSMRHKGGSEAVRDRKEDSRIVGDGGKIREERHASNAQAVPQISAMISHA